MIGDLRQFGKIRNDGGYPHMKTVPARKDALAFGDWLGRFAIFLLSFSLEGRQESQERQAQSAKCPALDGG